MPKRINPKTKTMPKRINPKSLPPKRIKPATEQPTVISEIKEAITIKTGNLAEGLGQVHKVRPLNVQEQARVVQQEA